jgi:serine/threonine protein kinase
LSWVSSQAISKPADQVTPDSSTFQDGPSTDVSGTDAAAIAPSSLGSGPSSQRKIYPGLKNTVGPYKLIRNIGQGSFSEVKMAVDTRTGEHVAVKVVNRAMIQASDRLGISVRRESDLLKVIATWIMHTRVGVLCFAQLYFVVI